MSPQEVSRDNTAEWAKQNIWRLICEGAKSGYEFYLDQLPRHERREFETMLKNEYSIVIVRR